MCRNGRYTEHGIKELDGFGSERWRIEPELVVKVDPGLGELGVLLEPTSIVAKAWEHLERIGGRAHWEPRRALVTGAGPIGLLAALLGRQRGLEVHVLDQVTGGPKPDLVRDLGAVYHHGSVEDACRDTDVAIECTGVGQLVFDVMASLGPNGIVCLTGVSSGHPAGGARPLPGRARARAGRRQGRGGLRGSYAARRGLSACSSSGWWVSSHPAPSHTPSRQSA